MKIQDGITRENVEFCRKWVAKYQAEAEAFETKAKNCRTSQYGAYRSNAAQKRKSARQMQANENALMDRLAENNPDLWLELKEGE